MYSYELTVDTSERQEIFTFCHGTSCCLCKFSFLDRSSDLVTLSCSLYREPVLYVRFEEDDEYEY